MQCNINWQNFSHMPVYECGQIVMVYVMTSRHRGSVLLLIWVFPPQINITYHVCFVFMNISIKVMNLKKWGNLYFRYLKQTWNISFGNASLVAINQHLSVEMNNFYALSNNPLEVVSMWEIWNGVEYSELWQILCSTNLGFPNLHM